MGKPWKRMRLRLRNQERQKTNTVEEAATIVAPPVEDEPTPVVEAPAPRTKIQTKGAPKTPPKTTRTKTTPKTQKPTLKKKTTKSSAAKTRTTTKRAAKKRTSKATK